MEERKSKETTREKRQREREEPERDTAERNGEGRTQSSRIDLVVGSAGGGAGTQVLLRVYGLSV